MVDRTEFLMHARRLHNALRREIEDLDIAPALVPMERPLFEHYASGFYLAGCLAFIEGKFGRKYLELKPPLHETFDQFLLDSQGKYSSAFSNAGISSKGVQALVCIRNAVIHNDGDLARNNDKNSLAKVMAAKIPGVFISESRIALSSNTDADFMEYVRMAFIAISRFHERE